MSRPVRGAFRFAASIALLGVGCGGRTSGSGGSTSGGVGRSGTPSGSGAVTGSIVGTAGASSGMPTMDEDAGCTEIAASSYDQSCKSDSDCVLVHVGSACGGCVFACGQNVGAVNAAATAQYIADVAKTPAGVGYCFCRFEAVPAPCCRDGQCHADDECSPLDGSTAAYTGPIEGDASTDAGSPASCAPGGPGMTNCGPGGSGTESCCTSLEVTGRTFDRTYDPHLLNDGGTTVGVAVAADGGPIGEAAPATVSSFRLDKYLVTVGRFRQFINALTPPDGGIGWLPSPGSGKHTHLNGGAG